MKVQRLLAIVVLALTAAATRGDSLQSCPDCGSPQPMRRVCRVVPDVQLVTTYEYFCRSETFCVPGRSRCVGQQCTQDCGPSCKMHCEKLWVPTAGPVYCRSKLCKRPVIVQQPCSRYIVEDVCCGCGHARIDRTSTEALQYARGLPPGGWQPLDEPPTLAAHAATADPVRTVQAAVPGDKETNAELTTNR